MENTQALSVREIGVITEEIKDICRRAQSMVLLYAVEIGRRLVEAKAALPHGSWGDWLKNEVEFSQRSANRFMKVYEEYSGGISNSPTLSNLSYTKALELLSVPADERENFVEENHADELSSREFKELIAERDRLLKEVDDAKQNEERMSQSLASKEIALVAAHKRAEETDQLKADLAKMTEDRDKKKNDIKKLRDQLKNAKENPNIPQEVIDRMRSELEEAVKAEVNKDFEKTLDEINNRLKEAEEQRTLAENAARDAEGELDRLQKELRIANPKVTEFKVLFESVQRDVSRLISISEDLCREDPDTGKRLRMAMMSLADSFSGG